ncbi:hypothetical protein Lsed01_02503 [Demequina sediminis]|uniref:TraD/TraG TraM recognition site domain-containing protein n=1 Tax=Demequina sediminis TaxID=1930058 RepID=A0ABP9WJQ0_9MICO|nr:TraM recognition domain-containing protein [Demequina sediminis]BDZ61101.1 hypothetical protein GCM10025873_08920 [Demequina sediminis]
MSQTEKDKLHTSVLLGPAKERRRDRKARRRAAAQLTAVDRRTKEAFAKTEWEAERARQKATTYLPSSGEARTAALRTPGRLHLPRHQDTSATLQGAYPFMAEGGFGSHGVFIGADLFSGSSFVYDPWVLYSRGIITAPNIVLAGIVGSGKSSLARSLYTRSIAFGRRVYVPGDPKGEHTAVAAAPAWGDLLQATTESDPRTRDSIWQGVSLALGALADPRVLDAVSPGEDEDFDPEAFLRESGTLYLLATGAGAGASSALVAALLEDLVETARKMAARSPGARLDPPLLMALDEIGNLAPLPSLPVLMAEGGGTGITTMPVLQSMAQARDRWGRDAATAISDASIAKVILGGASSSSDLQELSTLIGERDEMTDSITYGDRGSRANQRSIRRLAVMPPNIIRTLPYGTSLVLLRNAPPIITRMREWTARRDARTLKSDRAAVEDLLRVGPKAAATRMATSADE